jgi:pPIWI_RE module N-terminal domain/RNaseH domain of pPIWI_RE/MID domain of pPIWI_RE
MSKQFSEIKLLRHQVTEQYLQYFTVCTLEFSYLTACTDFLSHMKRLANEKNQTNESPPFLKLNTALCALSPNLAHGFERYWNKQTEQYERHLLAVNVDIADLPDTIAIQEVILEWAEEWVTYRFPDLINGIGQQPWQKLRRILQQPLPQWKVFRADQLLRDLDQGIGLGYQAIPNLFASLLSQETCYINNRLITWRSAQHSDKSLGVVSNILEASYTSGDGVVKKGSFFYKVELHLQTQIGSQSRWLHLYIRCQRLVDETIEHLNNGRNATVLVGIQQPRLSGWSAAPTLIRLILTGGNTSPRWLENPAQLLEAVKARSFVDPKEILNHPKRYRPIPYTPYQGDEYYLVMAEGYYPDHALQTGFHFPEKNEAAEEISKLLNLKLSQGQHLSVDAEAHITPQKGPQILYNFTIIEDKEGWKAPHGLSQEEKTRVKQVARHDFVMDAIRRATSDRTIFLFLFWQDSDTLNAWQQELREVLFLSPNDPWPDQIKIIPVSLPSTIMLPLDTNGLDVGQIFQRGLNRTEREKRKRDWKQQIRHAYRQKLKEWMDFIEEKIPASAGVYLALVEKAPLLRGKDSPYHISQDIKGIIRNAHNHFNVASQLTHPVQVSQETQKLLNSSPHRVHSGVLDLLYRQLGLSFDLLAPLYEYAGIEPEIASQLHTIGFYLLRSNKYDVNYPIAVRICPYGQFWLQFPQSKQQWLPYIDGSRQIGKLFTSENWKTLNLKKQDCAAFAANILTRLEEPTLALFEANNWRNRDILPQLANDYKQPNVLDLGHLPSVKKLFTSDQLPFLRIVRVRTVGTLGETPQYIPFKNGAVVKDLDYLGGYVDTQTESQFLHYLSIGKYPDSIDKLQKQSKDDLYKADFGSIAFKHQTAVEFVPVFLQKEDTPLYWCRIPHLLRSSSAWAGGNTTLPRPLHLASCLLNDQLCIHDPFVDCP